MFQEIFRIIFDRRHIKDVRIWVLVILAIANVSSFYIYDKHIVKPMQERLDKQGKRIRQIIRAGKLQEKIDALPQENQGGRE